MADRNRWIPICTILFGVLFIVLMLDRTLEDHLATMHTAMYKRLDSLDNNLMASMKQLESQVTTHFDTLHARLESSSTSSATKPAPHASRESVTPITVKHLPKVDSVPKAPDVPPPSEDCKRPELQGFLVTDANSRQVQHFKHSSRGMFMTFPSSPPFQLKVTDRGSLMAHWDREKELYVLMRASIAKQERSGVSPVVIDAGANHGTYSLYAAKLGATALAIEPQKVMVGNIMFSIEANKLEQKVRIYNNAVLDTFTGVHLRDEHVGIPCKSLHNLDVLIPFTTA